MLIKGIKNMIDAILRGLADSIAGLVMQMLVIGCLISMGGLVLALFLTGHLV